MNINFNVADDIGNTFLSSSRLAINQPGWTDDKVINKALKQFIGTKIDEYNKEVIIGQDEANLKILQEQSIQLNKQVMDAYTNLESKKNGLNIIPIDVP